MIAQAGLLEDLRQLAAQGASIPALRVSLLLCAVLAALAWASRRPSLALLASATGGFLGLGYWLVQIVSPLGLGTDPTFTGEWAQAGVNALAEPKGPGFVWGTEPGFSLVSTLALVGIPLRLVFLVPQTAVLMALGLAILLPFCFLKRGATASLASCLALGGGLWPGVAPYGPVLLHPSTLLYAAALFVVLLVPARRQSVRRAFRRARPGTSALLIAAATIGGAVTGGAEPGLFHALLLSGATILLTSSLRAALRKFFAESGRSRRAEAAFLLCAFSGSGLFWWNPPESVPGFHEARDANAALLRTTDWIRRNVPSTSVVLASPGYSAPIAALAGRRVLFPPPGAGAETAPSEPFRRARLAETTRLGQPLVKLADGFSVTHLLLGPGEANPPADADASAADGPRLRLVLVYEDAKDFRVFRLVKK